MPARKKTEAHTVKRSDSLTYSRSISEFLDGKGNMHLAQPLDWARALLLYLRMADDAKELGGEKNGAPTFDNMLDYARMLGSSEMIKREVFDEAAVSALASAQVTEQEARAFLDAIPDNDLKRVADLFDIEAGSLEAGSVRAENALRAIRLCGVPSRLSGTVSLPRSIAGLMGALCLDALDESGDPGNPVSSSDSDVPEATLSVAAPICGNGDALLGALDAASLIGPSCKLSLETTVYGGVEATLCKMALAVAGYTQANPLMHANEPASTRVPTGLKPASYDVVVAAYRPFEDQAASYDRALMEKRGENYLSFKTDLEEPLVGSTTEPGPSGNDDPLSRDLAFVSYCTNLLSERGTAALWLPGNFSRTHTSKLAGKALLQANLLHAAIEFQGIQDSGGQASNIMTLWLVKRGRAKDEPVLLAFLDEEGFDAYCSGKSETLYRFADKPIGNNPAALKALELIQARKAVDRCAVLVDPKTMLAEDTPNLRFIDYASNIDLVASLSTEGGWKKLNADYQQGLENAQESDARFVAALERFRKSVR